LSRVAERIEEALLVTRAAVADGGCAHLAAGEQERMSDQPVACRRIDRGGIGLAVGRYPPLEVFWQSEP